LTHILFKFDNPCISTYIHKQTCKHVHTWRLHIACQHADKQTWPICTSMVLCMCIMKWSLTTEISCGNLLQHL
jgi:hypothetical protein